MAEKYVPNAAPLNPGTLPEYVLRELRRIGDVVNKNFEAVEASLSVVAATPAGSEISASAGLHVYSATAGVVVLELDGSNLTSRSESVQELYYFAWDSSQSAAVRVPGDSLPGSGGGAASTATVEAELVTVVRINTAQSASYNVVFSLSWQEALVDTLGAYSGGTPTKLSIPSTGIYECVLYATVPSSSTGNQKGFKLHRNSEAMSNDAAFLTLIFDAAEAGERAASSVVHVSLNAGDTINVSVYQNAFNPAMDLQSVFFAESCQLAVRKLGSGTVVAGGGGGTVTYFDGKKSWDNPYETTASIVTWSGGAWDDFARGDSTLSVDSTGARFTGARPWCNQTVSNGTLWLQDGVMCFEGSGSYNSYFRLTMDPGTLTGSWSILVKYSFLSPMINYARMGIELFDSTIDPSASYTDMAASTYGAWELKYTNGRKIEIAQYSPFVSRAISASLDTQDYNYKPIYLKLSSAGGNINFRAFWSDSPGGLVYEDGRTIGSFGLTKARGIRLTGYGGATNANTRMYCYFIHVRNGQ